MKPPPNKSSAYKEARWHLLRVEKNGSLRPFIHFRGLVMMGAGLIFVMTGALGWLLVAWLDAREILVASQETVTRQERELEAIRNEKDGILGRLAIAESKLKALVPAPAMEKQAETLVLKEKGTAPLKPLSSPAAAPEAPPVNVLTAPQHVSETASAMGEADTEVIPEKVIADNLFVCASPDDTLLTIEFKVINMGSRKQPVSGHAFVILKDAHDEKDQWVVVPRAMLMDGRPVQSRGQRFRIYNFRTIKFKVANENPGVFVQATIFIFKETGELIFERDFTLDPIQICP